MKRTITFSIIALLVVSTLTFAVAAQELTDETLDETLEVVDDTSIVTTAEIDDAVDEIEVEEEATDRERPDSAARERPSGFHKMTHFQGWAISDGQDDVEARMVRGFWLVKVRESDEETNAVAKGKLGIGDQKYKLSKVDDGAEGTMSFNLMQEGETVGQVIFTEINDFGNMKLLTAEVDLGNGDWELSLASKTRTFAHNPDSASRDVSDRPIVADREESRESVSTGNAEERRGFFADLFSRFRQR